MSRRVATPLPVLGEGSLDEVGAVLSAIVRLTSHSGETDIEDTRAIYALATIGLDQWRKLDAAADTPPPSRAVKTLGHRSLRPWNGG